MHNSCNGYIFLMESNHSLTTLHIELQGNLLHEIGDDDAISNTTKQKR